MSARNGLLNVLSPAVNCDDPPFSYDIILCHSKDGSAYLVSIMDAWITWILFCECEYRLGNLSAHELCFNSTAQQSFILYCLCSYIGFFSYSSNTVSCILSPAVNCGNPGTPSNGRRTGSSTTYNSVVTYTCNTGYTRQGSNRRTCQSNGQWSGAAPRCNRKLFLYLHFEQSAVAQFIWQDFSPS